MDEGVALDEQEFIAAARGEYEIALGEINRHGPSAALVASMRRLDGSTAKSLDKSAQTTACGPGCWYCCYYKVDVRAVEVFRIIDFVRDKFSQEGLRDLREKVEESARIMRELSHEEMMVVNLECPFLNEQRSCSIYSVRPEKCRTFHATDVEGCKKSYENPREFVPNSYIPEIFSVNTGHSEGWKKALSYSGYDSKVYELNMALAASLTNSGPRKRFGRKKRAFSAAFAIEEGPDE